ncbi:MAG: polysaccharide biosynthesis/export family protein [Pseudomonadota bacterium]
MVAALLLSGCAHHGPDNPHLGQYPGQHSGGHLFDDLHAAVGEAANQLVGRHHRDTVDLSADLQAHDIATIGEPQPVVHVSEHTAFGKPNIIPAGLKGPQIVADSDGPYLLDTGDQLRVFVYGQPNLSRLYTVDHGGRISVPLIGNITARGMTTHGVASVIRDLLARDFVRDPQVTVDIRQNRPFFILGEVRTAGQFPYVSGMTVETAVAIAGGFTERANKRRFKITRRINGLVEVIEAPGDYVVDAGDTITVFERFF